MEGSGIEFANFMKRKKKYLFKFIAYINIVYTYIIFWFFYEIYTQTFLTIVIYDSV